MRLGESMKHLPVVAGDTTRQPTLSSDWGTVILVLAPIAVSRQINHPGWAAAHDRGHSRRRGIQRGTRFR